MISIWFVVLFFFILALITYNLKINKKMEGFGFDKDPSQFIEPSIHPNFITKEDADYILEMAEYNYEESIIVGDKPDGIRKSQTYWLNKDDPIAKKIITKVCAIDKYNIEQAEDIQVVKYEPNGYYKEHHDSCCDDNDLCKKFNKDGNRVLTMVIYLNDEFEGGSTRFPNIDKEYKPEKYSGILFYPMNKNGDKCHDNSLHAGMPVTSGEKYIANVWLRDKTY
jgi:prolyl 4-hydroxylase